MSSYVRPPWICPECGMANVWTTAACMNRRYDEASPRFMAIPPVPPQYGLETLGAYLETLGLKDVPPPAEVWRCSYSRPCDLCDRPGHPHNDGQTRCDEHPTHPGNVKRKVA